MNKDTLKKLTETNEIRINEEMTRPRIEMMFDDFAAWQAYHRAKDRGEEFTPHFGIGWN